MNDASLTIKQEFIRKVARRPLNNERCRPEPGDPPEPENDPELEALILEARHHAPDWELPDRSETILEARRKLHAGDFNQRVVKRIPVDLCNDRVELECGDTVETIASQRDEEACVPCCNRWIAENSREFDPQEVR